MKNFPERAICNENLEAVDFHQAQNLIWDARERYVIMSAGSQGGKDVALDTWVTTPEGHKLMADVQVGDLVIGHDGSSVSVTNISEIFTTHKCYQLFFDNGESVVCGEGHLWSVKSEFMRNIKVHPAVLPTSYLYENFGKKWSLYNTNIMLIRIEEVDTVPTKCIEVSDRWGIFLITKSNLPTHNSVFGPKWLHREIYHPEVGRGGGDYLAVTATFDLFKLKMLPSMINIFCKIYKVGKYWSGDRVIELLDPETRTFWARSASDQMWGRIILRSADSPGGLESATAVAVWADEMGQGRFTKQAYQAMRRRMTVRKARLLVTTTLYEPGWFMYDIIRPAKHEQNEVFVENDLGDLSYVKNKERDTFLVQFDSTLNPTFSIEEFQENKDTIDEQDFNMFFKGREGTSRYLIYDSYDRERHLCDPFNIPHEWERYIGLDYGGSHTCAVMYAENPLNEILYCYAIYLDGQKEIEEHARDILKLCGERPSLASGGAPGETQWRREFTKYGIFVQQPTISDVEVGIDRVYRTHKRDGIIYFNTLTGIIEQKETYSRVRNPETGKPTKEIKNKSDYHYIDAERYIIADIRPVGMNKVKVMSL